MTLAIWTHAAAEGIGRVPLVATAPFILLLLLIATGPLFFKHFWHRHYPKVSLALGAGVAAWYGLFRNEGGHGLHSVAHAGIEYIAFVSLVGSLFVIASTVLVHIRAPATTGSNAMLLGFAGILANLVGTTGASMLLIRPYLRLNRHRFGTHHVVFFIFIVANVGGSLTPIGDPPLFLGYLRGIPFFWTAENLALEWLLALAMLLAIFVVYDRLHARSFEHFARPVEKFGIEITGFKSFLYLLGVLALVFVQNEPFVKEHAPLSKLVVAGGMLGLAFLALRTADRQILHANEFSFEPVKEVAYLFAGIFFTMIPALQYLEQNARSFGIESPLGFYFATGTLSAFLDNAPTYLTFLTAELAVNGLSIDDSKHVIEHIQTAGGALHVKAISCGAVFFGAMTYIGNGPNFMVKSIVEAAGHKCPSFFGYFLRWGILVLFPVLAFTGVVFFYFKF
jgi:Na+/H+ antiporter NhaD/arsenite permease-like protein